MQSSSRSHRNRLPIHPQGNNFNEICLVQFVPGLRHNSRNADGGSDAIVKLTKKQAGYLGVPVEGPCKPEHYRY